jgi:hypothetical protein
LIDSPKGLVRREEEGRGKKEEGRGKKEEGRGKKEEGRRNKVREGSRFKVQRSKFGTRSRAGGVWGTRDSRLVTRDGRRLALPH